MNSENQKRIEGRGITHIEVLIEEISELRFEGKLVKEG